MRLNVSVALDLQFICAQCQRELEIQGQKVMNPTPILVCPGCGVKILVRQGAPLPVIPGPGKRIPALNVRKIP